MNQNFSFMRRFRATLLDCSKSRTNRAFSEFRDKCGPGDLMYIWIAQRSPDNEKLFNAICQEKYYWNIENAPKDIKQARKTESPIQGESWYEFASNDGIENYQDFLDFFLEHPRKTGDFICYIFKKK